MSLETCQLCEQDCTPFAHVNGHICDACYYAALGVNWINAKEKMPCKDGRYLVVEDHSYKWVGVSTMREGKFDMPITHWMPLPEKPENE